MSTTSALLDSLIGERTGGVSAGPTAIKAIVWARVSTDMQEARGLSMPEQLREIREYAEKLGIEILGEFHEAASAFQKEAKRVEFHRMLAAAKANPEVNAILVHDFSRFSRDSVGAKALVRELRQSGIKVISLNDPEVDPDTVAGVYMEAITFAKNEAYSREVAFHTRKGCRANVQTRDSETGWCYKNGGQPLFGYKSVQLVRGEEKRGRPIIKSIWVLDDTLVNGRPVHEWARECLLMAAGGASLDELSDFCNQNAIPGRRKRYWGISTWNALLEPHCLFQFCGYAVWNVHRKNGSIRPASEWVTVENAHPALISEEEAQAIAAIRNRSSRKRFDTGYSRSRTSPYLLSGGLFKCERCGSNMAGLRTGNGTYYVCGSQPYRKGTGCGPGVYVPKELVEKEVVTGLQELMGICADPKGMTRQVNEELRRIFEESTGYDPQAAQRVKEVERKIDNIWKAIEDGLMDAATANARLAVLQGEREKLLGATVASDGPPQIDLETALTYRRQTEKVLAQGSPTERKQILRTWVADMKLAPERLEVAWTYQIPEPVMHSVVAGAGYEALEKTRTRRWVWRLPFEALGRALDAVWEEAKLRLVRVESARKRR